MYANSYPHQLLLGDVRDQVSRYRAYSLTVSVMRLCPLMPGTVTWLPLLLLPWCLRAAAVLDEWRPAFRDCGVLRNVACQLASSDLAAPFSAWPSPHVCLAYSHTVMPQP
jgi:hypothetical protein